MPTLEIHWGETGSGKSMTVWSKYPNQAQPGQIPRHQMTKWYNGEDTIVFDNFEYTSMRLQTLRDLLNGECARRAGQWTTVVLILSTDPQEWYPSHRERFHEMLDNAEIVHHTVTQAVVV